MNYQTEMNAKVAAEQEYLAKAQCPAPNNKPYYGDMCGQAEQSATHAYTLRDEAAKQAQYHNEQAQKASACAAFLKEYPQFDDFVRLVRSGAIQF